MHSLSIIVLLTSTLAGLGAAAPAPAQQVARAEKEICQLTGWVTREQSTTLGPGASGGASNVNSMSSGFKIKTKDSDKPFWECDFGDQDSCNPLVLGGSTLKKGVTSLEFDVKYIDHKKEKGCECEYDGVTNIPGATSGSTYSGGLYNENTNGCTCTFPCNRVTAIGGGITSSQPI